VDGLGRRADHGNTKRRSKRRSIEPAQRRWKSAKHGCRERQRTRWNQLQPDDEHARFGEWQCWRRGKWTQPVAPERRGADDATCSVIRCEHDEQEQQLRWRRLLDVPGS
jgi:hypothetical protein